MARRVIAVIDVGSNSVRLLVARKLSPVAFEVIDEERFDARLGQDQDSGTLGADGIERAVRALRIMGQVAASFGPSQTIAVGTEALRRAGNADDFLDRVRHETGIGIRVLSGREEAFASFLGVVNSTTLRDGVVVDIGGGSLEVMQVEGRAFVEAQSAPLGAIYSTQRYLPSDPPGAREVRALRKAVRQQIPLTPPVPALFGVGGAVRNIARIVRTQRKYPLRRIHGLEISRRELKRLTAALARVTADERRKIPGVSSQRADILHASAIVLDELMEMSGTPALIVAGQGLREGLVWQEIRGEGAVVPHVRQASIEGLALANNVDTGAAEPVVSVAAQLYDALAGEHGLCRADLDLLLAGARLSRIGMHVDYYDRDRHAEYLVHSGDLHGFSHREIVLLGALVRCADSGTPDLSAYRSLIESDDSRRVAVLATLLGLARALYRRTPSPIHEVRVHRSGGDLTLDIRAGGPIDVEMYALERHQKRVESVLKLRLGAAVRP